MHGFIDKTLSIETALALGSNDPIQMSLYATPSRALTHMRHEIASTVEDAVFDKHYLPFIAERYRISRDLSNYIIVPITIMASDLPNRNLVAFPFNRLSEFNPDAKCLAYQTWRYAPAHKDHVNQDYTQSKGVVLDVGMRPMPNVEGSIWKVTALTAFDRSKDPHLVSDILDRKVKTYSMGAYVTDYHCSICGSTTPKPTEPKCQHIPASRNRLQVFSVKGEPTLAYWNVGSFVGFEISALSPGTPGAFPSTDNTVDILVE